MGGLLYSLLVAGVLGNAYVYMADLLAISDKRPVGLTSWPDIPNWSDTVTPGGGGVGQTVSISPRPIVSKVPSRWPPVWL